MNGILFTFRSITTAQRGEMLARSLGVDAKIRRTPRNLEDRGCGYSLIVEEGSGQRMAKAMREKDISFRRVFRIQGEHTEEMWL